MMYKPTVFFHDFALENGVSIAVERASICKYGFIRPFSGLKGVSMDVGTDFTDFF